MPIADLGMSRIAGVGAVLEHVHDVLAGLALALLFLMSLSPRSSWRTQSESDVLPNSRGKMSWSNAPNRAHVFCSYFQH